jgi:uncharacterized RDD family membrane protein YckC
LFFNFDKRTGENVNWYYLDISQPEASRQTGPFNEEAFNNLVEKGVIKADTLVWNESLEQWKLFASIESGADINYATIQQRAGAWIIDAVITTGICALIFYLLEMPILEFTVAGQPTATTEFLIISHILTFFYNFLFVGLKGATPGKIYFNLKVVNESFKSVGLYTAALRHLGLLISGALFMIGYLTALFDGQKRTLHDFICKTRVIQSKL